MTNPLLGAVEAGGTKFRAAVASGDMAIVKSALIPTSDPASTLAAVAEFFAGAGPVAALGIASFGPVDLDPDSPGYGSITDTPKPLWSGAPILGRLSESLGVPTDIQTDVEAAAVAEQVLGPERPVSAANESGNPEAELARPRPERPVSAANKSGNPEAELARPRPERPVSAANKSGNPEAELARPRPERPVSAANKSGNPEAELARPRPERPVSAANKSGNPEAELARPRPERPVSAANKSGNPEAELARPLRLAYVAVGTGIGAAVAVDGKPLRGRRHSELGHIPVRRVAGDDYPGHCPFHRDCLEGMACGPAMAERWGVAASDMDGRDDIWHLEAAYLAQLVRVLAYSFAPDRIVFGGGVGGRPGLAEMIEAASRADLGGYADYTAGDGGFVTAPALGDDSGLLGAALLARSLP